MHRDYPLAQPDGAAPSSSKGGPGVIDFQDALRGPVGYDLVSLLKDCYISWSRERVERWVRGYRRVLGNLGANVGDSEYQFLRWFDLIGVQRHIKVLGIFCRLWYRDGKIGYLADLPLTFEYVRDACRRYPELVEFERWLAWRIAPLLEAANAREITRAMQRPRAAPHAQGQAQAEAQAEAQAKPKPRQNQAQSKQRQDARRRRGAKRTTKRVARKRVTKRVTQASEEARRTSRKPAPRKRR